MRTLILGAGGIGGYYGGRLVQSGADVSFLVRPARAATLSSDGLVIEAADSRDRIAVRTITEADRTYDLILVSCKAYDLDGAIDAIRPAVGPSTIVLPLLNGIAHLDRLDAAFGKEKVIGGTAHISVTLGADGAIRKLADLHLLTYGERDPATADTRCDAIEALFEKAAFDGKRSDAIMQEMWEKFAFITAASGITCLLRASVGAIMDTTDGERLVLRMLDECAAVAEANGHPLRPKPREWGRRFLTSRGSPFTASMMRDLESGARVEADHLQGDMIARGEAKGVDVELVRLAYCALQSYAARRSAG